MEGMFIGEEIAGSCTVGFRDGVREGIFEMKIIGDGTAEACAVVSNDGDRVTV